MVGIIIGKGGEQVSRIIAASGAVMQIEKEHEMAPGETHRKITIRGKNANALDLKRRVEEIVEQQTQRESGNRTANKTDNKDMNYPFIMKVPVPNDKVGIIIGKLGQTVKDIQTKTQTNIQIPQQGDADNPAVRTLSIGGYSKNAIESAQMEIFLVLQTFHQVGTAKTTASANMLYIQVPDDKVGLIIGQKGMTIKDLQSKHGIRIQIPPSADANTYPPVRTIRYIVVYMY